jgi:SsrA-binding protein
MKEKVFSMKSHQDLVSNRKAFHDYEILESFESGIALLGTEVKSLKVHEGSLQDAYVTVRGNDLYLINSNIPPYRYGTHENHEERRERKLLMHFYEIEKIKKITQEKGMTVIPLSFYLKKGIIKLRIAVAKGKKSYDKRSALKEKAEKRDAIRDFS